MRQLWVGLVVFASLGLASCSSTKSSSSADSDLIGEDILADGGVADTDLIPQSSAELSQSLDSAEVGTVPPVPTEQELLAANDPLAGGGELPQLDSPPAPAPAAESLAPAESAAVAAPLPLPSEPEAAPTEPAAPAAPSYSGSGSEAQYTVQRNDTLMKVAFELYGNIYDWKKIYDMNRDKIPDPNRIPAGTQLRYEQSSSPVVIEKNGEQYMIKHGDTLGTISYDIYGTEKKWKRLWENNKQLIKDPNQIFAGFYLYYTITPEERDEADKLKQERGLRPAPLADSGKNAERSVASGGNKVIGPQPAQTGVGKASGGDPVIQ